MKNVFQNSEIAHIWANQSQNSGRNSDNNLYFQNGKIYSYGNHFVIAKHVVNIEGLNGVLFTERSYSNTTAKHISIVRQAVSHKNIIYCYYPDGLNEQNFNCWLKEVEDILPNLMKAKKPEIYLNKINNVKDNIKNYADFLGLEIPTNLLSILNIVNKEQFAEYNNKVELFKNEEKIRLEKIQLAKHKEDLKKWLNFETYQLYNRIDFDYLRLNNNTNIAETTQQVKIPLNIAIALYESILNNTLVVGAKFMSYEVLKVGSEIKIGCHTFKKSYLLNFGKKLQVVAIAA